MTNKLSIYFFVIVISYLFPIKANSVDQFIFDVTNIEILDDGNTFIGKNGGTIKTNNGITINANSFKYNKIKNTLTAVGDVKIEDNINKYSIYAEKINYFKDVETIYTEGNSKAFDYEGKIITANKFEYNKIKNSLAAFENVEIKNKIENYNINTEKINFFRNEEKIFTEGNTTVSIHSKYKIKSEDLIFLTKEKKISSKKTTSIKDNNKNVYHLDNFVYLIDKEQLKGKNILAISNYGLPKSDQLYFSNAIINLKNQNFVAKDTEIKIHNDVFGDSNNNPRLKGVSSKKNGDVISINKGVFTSCNENVECPAWSIKANEIKHDKSKKQIIYEKAVLNIYNFPVLYFPKFFHPDPSVERQSGFLKPQINNSHIVGSSFTLPYFYAPVVDKDFTFTTTLFDKNMQMLQTEFRNKGKNYDLIADVSYLKGYKSSTSDKKKNLSHFFGKLDLDLKFEDFISSKFIVDLEKTSNDTYLKIFDANIVNSNVKPKNFDVLDNKIKLFLDHEKFDFTLGFQSFEDLRLKNSDRYQYVLPYYNFNKNLSNYFNHGSISLNSNGTNELKNTNNLKTRVINDLSYKGKDFVTDLGFKNNFNINFKNLNSVGKNDTEYKSSPQVELMSNFEILTSLPLIKKEKDFQNYFTPKLSLNYNPGDMKDYSSSSEKKINIDNIFSNNRLGIIDSFESGTSLTVGIDYKKEKLKDINKFFEMKIATSFRNKEEKNIPKISTLNRKQSNIFGSVSNNFSENLSVEYSFALDNDFTSFEYNDFGTQISFDNLTTEFNFIEENGEMGNSSFFDNSTSYYFNENNILKFSTRRNRKLNLTEFYDLVYQYKNDCLIAGIQYKKTYYEDRDLKPSENLFFSVTIIPVTTYEHKLDQ